MRHDLLSDIFSAIKNGDAVGRKEAVAGYSELAKSVLAVLQKHGYIGNYELVDDKRGGRFKITLTGSINSCNAIRPRFSVKKGEWEKWERRFLPAAGFGFLIVSTNNGITTHEEAKKNGTGGKLLGFVY